MLGDAAPHGGHRLERLARQRLAGGDRSRSGGLRRRRRRLGAERVRGRRGRGASAAPAGRCGARRRRRCCAPPDSTNARMSFFVTRPPAAGAGDLARVDAVLRRDPRDDRRDERLAVAVAAARRGGRSGAADGSGAAAPGVSARRRSFGSAAASRRRLGGRRLGLGAPARRASPAAAADLAELRPDVDGLAFLDEDLRQRPGRRARHLGVDLVGRDLEQRLVGLDVLALLLEPARDRALRDGHAHLRHHDVDCGLRGHATPPSTPRARAARRRRRRPAG